MPEVTNWPQAAVEIARAISVPAMLAFAVWALTRRF